MSRNKGFKTSDIIKKRISLANMGKNNGIWKGNSVGNNALHAWIKRHKPKSMFCEKCGKITDKLDCANISGEYKRDISDFRWLCRSCHMKEDGRLKRLYESRKKRKIINELYECSSCKELKKRNEFGNDKNNRDGVNSYCYKCQKLKRREQYLREKEKIKREVN